MRNILKLISIFALVIFMAGCSSSRPSEVQLSNANYGALPDNYEQQIKDLAGASLKDPDSAEYKFGTPYKGYLKEGLMYGGKFHYGYLIPVMINAKNSYGAYVGYHKKLFIFTDGRLYDAIQFGIIQM